MEDNRYYEIDIYPFSNTNAICEIELCCEDENFKLPNFIHLVKEVTGDKKYSNYSLSKNVPADLL